jgi:mannose-6-phosphate isomerase-like protein (cupin superfamily)
MEIPMQILSLESGIFFQMGKGQNWRVVHPDMGAKQITLNHGKHAPGLEFTQHTHDETEDVIVVLDGNGAIRQGSIYTPIKTGDSIFVPAHEVHGTVNTSDKTIRVFSFQSPPDMALYRGQRDSSADSTPKPEVWHISGVQVIEMDKAGPIFGKPGDWRNVVSKEKGSKHISLDYIKLSDGDEFQHEPLQTESIYVLMTGIADLYADEQWRLKSDDVIFLSPGDTFHLKHAGGGPTKLVHCSAI